MQGKHGACYQIGKAHTTVADNGVQLISHWQLVSIT
nr:MAG TPA: hypothetical protein [Caudoviricetes sp.]